MKTLRTTMAVALLGLAVTAFQSDALAQTRRGTGSTTSRTVSTSRSTSGSASRTSVTKSSSTSRPSTSSIKSSESNSTTRPTVSRSIDKRSGKPAASQPSTSVTSPTRPTKTPTTKPATRPAAKPALKPSDKPSQPIAVTRPGAGYSDKKPGGQNVRPSNPVQVRPGHKPEPHRVHPRDHDFMHFSKPSYYWSSYNHYYGYRVRVLPTHAHRHHYHGVTYYCYNDIWYRPYGGYYVVCRPPFGTILAANLIADMTWAAIRFSYYNTVARTYSQISENNAYIAQQNAVIAQNNATIAAQNAQIAAGQQQAQAAYQLADALGLVQSYAAAGSKYYYQDGVFYSMDADGQYSVIVPPAGALVETLPEDYDMVTLADGNEYYKVDDTVYKVTIVEGKPYFEVLGQLYQ